MDANIEEWSMIYKTMTGGIIYVTIKLKAGSSEP